MIEPVGTIYITLENVSYAELEVLRKNIHIAITQGAFGIRNGSATLHFNPHGIIQGVDWDIKRWRADKPEYALALVKPSVKIELLQKTISQTHNNEEAPAI